MACLPDIRESWSRADHPDLRAWCGPVEVSVLLGDPGLAFFYLKGAQVMLSLGAVTRRPGAELVQVPVGPAEDYLDDLVDLIEKQVRGQFQPPPERRPGPPEVDPETVSDDVGAMRPPP